MANEPFAIDATNTTLIVIDLQNDFVRQGAPQEVPDARTTLPAVASLLKSCRDAGMPVVFTRYTAGAQQAHLNLFSPECGPETKSCWPGVMRSYGDRDEPMLGHEIVDELSPGPDDQIIDKSGYGAFHDTNLDDVLASTSTKQIWLVGTVTQICVEETAREGFRRGYEVVIAADGVSSFNDAAHDAALNNLAHKFAVVSDTATMTARLESRTSTQQESAAERGSHGDS